MADLTECYRVLGLEPGATKAQVRQAKLDSVKVWHPDKHDNDPPLQKRAQDRLRVILAAYAQIESAGFPPARSPPAQPPPTQSPTRPPAGAAASPPPGDTHEGPPQDTQHERASSIHCVLALEGRFAYVTKTPYVIGRGRESDLRIEHPNVSRRHAELLIAHDGDLLVRDLDTTHGTTVNGERVRTGRLQVNDILGVEECISGS